MNGFGDKMTNVSVHLAETAKDFEAARALCREWLDWHWANYPSDWPKGADHPMDPENFNAILQDLPKLHERPKGGVLVGTVDGEAVGCVMYQEADAGVAEFNRMFVSEGGRGHGLGGQLLDHMFRQMVEDGYRKVFFSSAAFLTHAKAMYERAGFQAMPHPAGFPEDWRERVYFMERSLP